MPSKRRDPPGRRDSGVVAVETGLVSMFLVLLLFGIIDASFFFKDWLTISSAARAGARMGASEPRVGNVGNTRLFADDSADQVTNAVSGLAASSLASINVWVYKADGTTGLPTSGLTSGIPSCTSNCVKYTWPGGATKLTYLSGSWAYTSQNACNGDAARDTLGVWVKYSHASPLGSTVWNRDMSESTVIFLEPIPSSQVCKP